MKRLLLLSTVTLLLVILIGSSAFATLARIRALGNTDNYFKDIYHIYTNPSYLGMYTNTVYGELGTYSGFFVGAQEVNLGTQFLGINYKIYKGLSLGLTLNREVSSDFSFLFGQFPSPINQYDLMASYDFERLHLGLSLYHAGNKYEYKTTNGVSNTETGSIGNTALTGGFVFNFSEKHEIEGVLRLNFDRGKHTFSGAPVGSLETDGGNGIQFGARGFFQMTDDFQVIPIVAFASETIKLKGSGNLAGFTSTGDAKENFFMAALGGNLKLEKGMVAGGLNLTRQRSTDETDTTFVTEEFTTWFIPGFNLGVEYELTKWLTARLGMEKEFVRAEDKYHFENSVFHDNKFRMSGPFNSDDFIGLGVGFKFSKFQVDATVGENSFFEGTYLLSGMQRNLFGTLSAVFTF